MIASKLDRVRALGKTVNFAQRYGAGAMNFSDILQNPEVCAIIQDPPRYGTKADDRKRPRRIRKKIDKRGGYMTYRHGGGNMFSNYFAPTTTLGHVAARSVNQFVLRQWDDANRDVINDLVDMGVPREERKLILKGLRRITPTQPVPPAMHQVHDSTDMVDAVAYGLKHFRRGTVLEKKP